MTEIPKEAIEAAARGVRRRRLERTRRIGVFAETTEPTENELDDAEAALTAALPFLAPKPTQSDKDRARKP